jgi:hypothetical protein
VKFVYFNIFFFPEFFIWDNSIIFSHKNRRKISCIYKVTSLDVFIQYIFSLSWFLLVMFVRIDAGTLFFVDIVYNVKKKDFHSLHFFYKHIIATR